MTDSIEVIVHGPRCPSWPYPQTTDEWLAAQLVKDVPEPDDWDGLPPAAGVWRCPFCLEAIMVFFDHGTIDFGVEQPDLLRDNSVVMETFTPIVRG